MVEPGGQEGSDGVYGEGRADKGKWWGWWWRGEWRYRDNWKGKAWGRWEYLIWGRGGLDIGWRQKGENYWLGR